MKLLLPTLFILFLAVAFVGACSQTPYEINKESASEILETLSSNEMRGRQAFTPDIDRAADVIAGEFEEIGLSYFSNLENYRQEFSVIEYSIASHSVSVNGNIVSGDKHFGFVNGEEINWSPGSVSVAVISEGDQFRSSFREIMSSDENLLVFVDEAHAGIFDQYRGYFGQRSSRVMEGEEGVSRYFLMAEPADDFDVAVTANRQEMGLSNIVGKIEGDRRDEIVVFSAHYDHIGIQNVVEGDSIANGANDNASGVTAIIELARHFESLEKPERTLLFVGFTAEEMGGYGSQYFSRQIDPDNIVAMFNIEMIGKPAVSGPNTAWITGYERSSFGELLSKSAEDSAFEFYPDPYPNQNLFYRSDNATLARLGVPAHTISTTPIDVDPDYHQVSDEFDTINLTHMTNTIRAIANAAEGIVSGEDTPTRIDASQVD